MYATARQLKLYIWLLYRVVSNQLLQQNEQIHMVNILEVTEKLYRFQ